MKKREERMGEGLREKEERKGALERRC